MLAATDTHALIWAATGQRKRLGRRARALFDAADRRQGAVYVPTFVLAEVGELAHRGLFTLPSPFPQWVRELRGSGSFIPLDLTPDVVIVAHELLSIPERGDRLIAATAVAHQLPLISRDPEIAKAAGVELIWA